MTARFSKALAILLTLLCLCSACSVSDASESETPPRQTEIVSESPGGTTEAVPPAVSESPATEIFEPTAEPTIEPSALPTPAVEATPEHTIEPSAETNSIDVDDSYFTNSVFVGDSVIEGLAQYVRAQRNSGVSMLSDAKFLTTTYGIKIADIVGDTADVSYSYQGAEKPLETILREMGVTRAFIMLGMNDMASALAVDETIDRYRRMLALLVDTNPEVDIIVFTVTPKTATKWLPSYCANKNFGSPLLNELAEEIKAVCVEEGYKCFDINAVVRDANGNLPDDYSRDDYVHINNKCSEVVLTALREFAKAHTEEEYV